MPPREDDDYSERDDDDGEGEPEETVEAKPSKTSSLPKRNSKASRRNGVGALGGAPEDSPREAELLWLWILARLPSEGRSAYDVTIQVLQLDPPASNGRAFMVGSFGGGAIRGSETVDPSQALISYVTDNFHMPRSQSRQSVTYQIRFIWASNSQQMKRGDLTLPPRDEIIAVRQEEMRQRQANGEPVTPYAPPPMHQGVAGLPQQQSPQPFGFPPSYYPPPAGSDSAMMPALLSMIQEMWRAQLEGRPPNPAAAGVAAPPPAPLSEDSIVQKTTASVLMALQQAGILTKPAAGVAAATPAATPAAATPATPNSMTSMMERTINRMFEAAIGEVEKNVKKTIAGVGKPQDDDDYFDDDNGKPASTTPQTGVGAPPPAKPAEDAFELPWSTKPVADAKWGDGRPVVYAEDRETGGFSWQGALMSNPTVLEKGMEAAQGLAGALTDIVKQVGAKASAGFAGGGGQPPQNPPPQMAQKTVSIPPAATVVAETPAGAVDATPKSWKDGD